MRDAKFQLVTPYKPAGDQPAAIAQLTEGLAQNEKNQVLLGVTGSGKTFTVAKVIEAAQRPNVELRVLPLSAGERAVISGSFVLMHFRLPSDSHLVFVESLMSALYLEKPEEIAGYTLAFDTLRASALSPKDSLTTIRAAREDL